MATYRIYYSTFVDVEADSALEAQEKTNELLDSDFLENIEFQDIEEL